MEKNVWPGSGILTQRPWPALVEKRKSQMHQRHSNRRHHHYRRSQRDTLHARYATRRLRRIGENGDQSHEASRPFQTAVDTVEQLSQPPSRGYGPEPGPRDAYSNGPEHRTLLPGFVLPNGKRGLGRVINDDSEDEYDSEDDGDGDDRGNSKREPMSNFLANNRDEAFGMNTMNQPEMLNAMSSKTDLPAYAVKTLSRRFKRAQARAMDVEATAARGLKVLMPSASAARYANDKTRVIRVFDAGTRIRDMDRAMGFYRNNAEACAELERSIQTSGASGRRQFGDHAKDVQRRVKLSRLAQDRHWSTPNAGGGSSNKTPSTKSTTGPTDSRLAAAAPPAAAASRKVGRNMPQNRRFSRRPSRLRGGGVGPLDIPVFSRASWEIHGEKVGDDEDEPDTGTYYDLGNAQFLAAKLGLRSKKAQARARDDALAFFQRRFGLDFNPSTTKANVDPDTENITHGSLPLIMEAYSVAGNLTAQIRVAEGHLASSDDGDKDHLGNGMRLYAADRNLIGLTSVSEAGWRVRNTSKHAVPLAGARQTGLMLPRGSLLATGFWVLERPQAAPVLLRFQSSGPAAVKNTLAVTSAHESSNRRGVTHELTARWDVYDMAHDAVSRPTKGIGRAVSVIQMTQRRDSSAEQKSRTLLTIHH